MPACPVCQQPDTSLWSTARDYEYFSTAKDYQYYHCLACSTLFIYPVPVHELKQIYPSNYYSFVTAKKGMVTRIKEALDHRHFKKILKEIKTPSVRVLDVGGGTGWLAGMIREIDNRVTVTQIVDIDNGANEAAISNGHLYFEGILEDFVTTQKYELILMLNLIEHVANPLQVIKKAAALLAPGGLILVKTPNYLSLDARWFRNSYWGGLHCPRHWVIFSEKSFIRLVKQTDLRINKLQYTQGAPFWAFSIIAWMHRKGLIRVSAQKPIIFHFWFAPISGLFAGFDFIRGMFSKTSQMFIELKKADNQA
jgi:2-polyprenyl-3-methyl-5-hydroxy-6-metoxy-1,4-benzoquinol methylase